MRARQARANIKKERVTWIKGEPEKALPFFLRLRPDFAVLPQLRLAMSLVMYDA
jgi:hypothetical protein